MMESNVNLTYKDTVPAKPLDKATLNKMIWMSTMLQASFNYERMQAAGWLWSILPGLKKIHTNKEDLAASMTHNLDFFNTHTYTVNFVLGIVMSLEQQKADISTIRAVRTSIMGPLGGIGDALIWFALYPIVAGITATMAIQGNIAGVILYFVLIFGVQMALRYFLTMWSYKLGTNAIAMLTKNAKELTRAVSILGIFVIGALTCNYANVQLGMVMPNGESEIAIQQMLDNILPSALSLGVTMLCFYLIKKRGWSPSKCIFLLLGIGIVGCMFGIFGGAAGEYQSLISVPWHA